MSTLCPGNVYEGWGKGERKMGKARQCPAYAQATGRKGGKRVDERWESSEKAQPMPMQRQEGWVKGGPKAGEAKQKKKPLLESKDFLLFNPIRISMGLHQMIRLPL